MNSAYSRMCGLAIMLVSLGTTCICQVQQSEATDDNPITAPVDLPDAPSAELDKSANPFFGVPVRLATGIPTKKFHRVVQPNEFAEPLDSRDKLELAFMSRLTPADLASTVFSAGWSHVCDSSPHYGTDSGAFGERLGALALKQTTQSIFSYGIYASLFHDDPRYYVMSRQRSIGVRALYSASRVVITQKDDGRVAINWPKFAGIVTATALTNAYYPERDRGFANGAKSFGVSLWDSILNDEIHEFIGDGLRLLHRHRN